MALVKRQPRKLIKISKAATLLGVGRTTIKTMIERGEITEAPRRGGKTTSRFVYEAQINRIATEWGIL